MWHCKQLICHSQLLLLYKVIQVKTTFHQPQWWVLPVSIPPPGVWWAAAASPGRGPCSGWRVARFRRPIWGTSGGMVGISVTRGSTAFPCRAVKPSPVRGAVLFPWWSILGWRLGWPLVPISFGTTWSLSSRWPGPLGCSFLVWSIIWLWRGTLVIAATFLLSSPAGRGVGLPSLLGPINAVWTLPVFWPAPAVPSVLNTCILGAFGHLVLLRLLNRPVSRLTPTTTLGAGFTSLCWVPSRFPTFSPSRRDGFTWATPLTLFSISYPGICIFFGSRVITLKDQAHAGLNLTLHQLAVQLSFNHGSLFFQILQQGPVVQTWISRGGRGFNFSMAGGTKQTSGRGRGGLFAFVFPVFVTMFTFTVLVLVRGMLVFLVLTTVFVFFPLVFTTATVMSGPFLCLLTISFCFLLGRNNTWA